MKAALQTCCHLAAPNMKRPILQARAEGLTIANIGGRRKSKLEMHFTLFFSHKSITAASEIVLAIPHNTVEGRITVIGVF